MKQVVGKVRTGCVKNGSRVEVIPELDRTYWPGKGQMPWRWEVKSKSTTAGPPLAFRARLKVEIDCYNVGTEVRDPSEHHVTR